MEWLADSLIDLVGMTDSTTQEYLIALAAQAKSEQDLAFKLSRDDLLPVCSKT